MTTVFSGKYAAGITLTSTSQNPIQVTGTITPASGIALFGPGGGSNTWTIANSGVIGGGAGSGIALGNTVTYVANAVVTNAGSGRISGANIGVNIGGPGTLTNLLGGTITGTQSDGVYFGSLGNGTVVNSGMIIGGFGGTYMRGGGVVVNNAGATISGNNYGVKFHNGTGTITNAGVITGPRDAAVIFYTNSTSNRLIVKPGASFNGHVYGGTGVIELASAASAGTLAGFGGSITNFGSLQFDTSGQWLISGNASTAGLGTIVMTGFAGNDTIDVTGFAAVSDTFANNALVLTDASSHAATLHVQGTFTTANLHVVPDGSGGTDITLLETFNWIGGSADWNTPSGWDQGVAPFGADIPIIANSGSNTVTIGNGDSIAVASVTVAASDTLSVSGTLAAQSIVDNSMLSFVGRQTLSSTSLSVGGTVAVQSGGTLTLAPAEIVTASGLTATMGGGGTIINQGTISAALSGGTLSIAPLSFVNQGTVLASYDTLALGYDVGGVQGSWSNTGIISLRFSKQLILDGVVTTGGLGQITGAVNVSLAGTLNNTGTTLSVVGAGEELRTVNLTNTGVVLGGTIADPNDSDFTFNGGTFSGVTYQGPLYIATYGGKLNVANGLVVSGVGGSGHGTIDLTGGDDAQLNFIGSQTIDNATINLNGTDSVNPLTEIDIGGGTGPQLTLGPNLTVSSTATNTQADIRNSTNQDVTSVVNLGTIIAAAAGGSFLIAPDAGFTNDGTIFVGNSDALDVSAAIGPGTGIIEIATKAVARFTAAVTASQTVSFMDATGTLALGSPANFAATIVGFNAGDTIDLADIKATTATWRAGTSGQPGQLSIFNGTTLLATLALAGDYSAATFEVNGDNAGGSAITVGDPPPCFAAGTRILTPRGNVPIERLREGDTVLTVSGGRERIQWIGYRDVDCRRHIDRQRALPIRVAAHAFGQDRPKRPLLLSPDHSVFVEGVLIPIKFLVNDSTIRQIEVDAVSYFHIELERHEVVLADGLPAETYLETGGRNAFANSGGVMQLHPDFAPDPARVAMIWQSFGYAPLLGCNGELERTVRMLALQAAMLEGAVKPRSRYRGAA